MKALHPEQLNSLKMVPKGEAVTLMTRHSLREDPDNLMAGFTAPLTPAGVELARAWGAGLGGEIAASFSSHSPRCLDTARAMIAGAGSADAEAIVADILCEPGCFVVDMKAAGRRFVDLGPIDFMGGVLRGDPIPGTRSGAEGVRAMLDWLRSARAASGITLCVTHDTILAGVAYELLGKRELDESDWPWMLEGLFLWFDAESLFFVWRGEKGRRSFAELGLEDAVRARWESR